MNVWVISGRTESGDDIGPYVLDYKPTELEIHEIVKADMPEEYRDYDNEEEEAYLPPERYDEAYAQPYVSSASILSRPERKPNEAWIHESHDVRYSTSERFDIICDNCHATDMDERTTKFLKHPCAGETE